MKDEDETSEFCRWAATLIPEIEKVDARAAKLKRWVPKDEEWDEHPEVVSEFDQAAQDGTVNELLSLVAKYPERADFLYFHATRKAMSSGDFERARKIVNDHITSPHMRQQLLAQVDADQRRAIINSEVLEEVQTRANAIDRVEERVWFLLSAANRFGIANQKAAFKLLNQANEIVDGMKPGREQIESQMAIAVMYCFEKNDRGLAIMESLVPRLNELVEVAAKLDGYDTHYLRDGEWNMSANGPLGELLTRLAHRAAYFAWCDFDRSVSLAAQFERAEIRMMAQVKLAQGILAGPPKRLQMGYSEYR